MVVQDMLMATEAAFSVKTAVRGYKKAATVSVMTADRAAH
jgi:hypothetical protein